jgi:hypothetical protein
VAAIVAVGRPAVICAHRENLPLLLAAACAALGSAVPEGAALGLGGFWVLHAADGALVASERHHPAERLPAAGDTRVGGTAHGQNRHRSPVVRPAAGRAPSQG